MGMVVFAFWIWCVVWDTLYKLEDLPGCAVLMEAWEVLSGAKLVLFFHYANVLCRIILFGQKRSKSSSVARTWTSYRSSGLRFKMAANRLDAQFALQPDAKSAADLNLSFRTLETFLALWSRSSAEQRVRTLCTMGATKARTSLHATPARCWD